MEDLGAIAHMSGIAVHAGWRPYRGFNFSHAPCNAHHLRELQGVGVVWDQGWANDLADLLIEATVAVEEAMDARATDLDATTSTGIASEATALRDRLAELRSAR